MSPKIAVLAGGALFADGVISRMRRSYPAIHFDMIDAGEHDMLGKIIACAMDILVLVQPDANLVGMLQNQLYPVLPHLKMIIIESHSDRARILQWNEQPVNQVGDIMNMIHTLVEDRSSTQAETSR